MNFKRLAKRTSLLAILIITQFSVFSAEKLYVIENDTVKFSKPMREMTIGEIKETLSHISKEVKIVNKQLLRGEANPTLLSNVMRAELKLKAQTKKLKSTIEEENARALDMDLRDVRQKMSQTRSKEDKFNIWAAFLADLKLNPELPIGSHIAWYKGEVREPILMKKIDFNLIPIAPGSFQMGSPNWEEGHTKNEILHRVKITKFFWISSKEVTQDLYKEVMGQNYSNFISGQNPVDSISYKEALLFCNRLTAYTIAKGYLPIGYKFDLPTEAEWEYACRAGTSTATAFGNSLNSIQANFNGNSPYRSRTLGPSLKRTAPVGSYKPNAWGLYDMHGNVWEWCKDAANIKHERRFKKIVTDTYINGASDPLSLIGKQNIIRGGSWVSLGTQCRSASRKAIDPESRDINIGFRVVLRPQLSDF